MISRVLRSLVVAIAGVLGVAAATPQAAAGIETYTQIDLEEPFEMFGFGLSIIAIPEIQGVVIESRIMIMFTPGAGFDASEFTLDVLAPTQFGPDEFGNIWVVEGTGLGWMGSETVMASVTSTALAGLILPEPEFAVWEVFLGPNVGIIQELVIEHDYVPVPAPGAAVVLLMAGAAVQLRRRRAHN